MTKSDWLPEKGAIFELEYNREGRPVIYGKEPHDFVTAVSPGLKVLVYGEDSVVLTRRQAKPMLPAFFNGEDGAYRRMLVVNLGDVWIHVLGDKVVVARESLMVGRLVNDESLTPADRIVFDAIKKAVAAKEKEDRKLRDDTQKAEETERKRLRRLKKGGGQDG